MLYNLHVKNLALINEQEVEFENGLNIMSGETGAGKSVIIGSVNLALGAKADSGMIRTGAEYALIELTFGIKNEAQLRSLKELDIPVEEDGTLILQRKIMEGRSVCKANGETVSARQLRDLSNILINIHGQNDHQELLHKKKHLEILDDFAGEELLQLKEKCAKAYGSWKDVLKALDETNLDERERERQKDLANFEYNEITDADPKEGEDEELETRYRRMVNSRKIAEAAGIAAEVTGAGDSGESAADAIGRAVRELSSVSSYDDKAAELLEQLSDIDNLLSDFRHAISSYIDELEFDPEDFATTEDRLNTINHLKDKYGGSIEEVLKYRDEKEEELKKLEDLAAYRDGLLADEKRFHDELLSACKSISDLRKENAKALSELLRKALEDLNFIDVRFEIDVKPDGERVSAGGYDDVEFMISTNPGERIRPLDQVASGGELSRIMLAIKTVVAEKDDIDTLIFDEIDAGISGQTAWKVSEKLGLLAKGHQIICITHLPQIASMADTHYEIAKGTHEEGGNERTVTRIRKLSDDERASELARMLGGATITDSAMENAREMMRQAEKVKSK
ncbi:MULTISPECIES: DNA repair protein RecN [unclassified Butyrivibrio]|uniref:DNA repair protein RecN n=1 Tax=unclassified Butyrivibrio TaxID=2639466 RepID=UPI00042A3EB1|nr:MULTISPECIES: DNA repair protein RecN [unclassified Butyrivibrio]SEL41954.1 DNA repair protein RecN (Recombination protein N) [Butyrivibrio sp. ob235]